MALLSIAQNAPVREQKPSANAATEYYQQQITEQVLKQLDKIDWNHVDRTTSGSGSVLYTIPVVVHVLHNYGPELVADTIIYNWIDKVNSYFLKTNPDTVNIIDKFKSVAASTQIQFKLATIDPYGNQTKGVEHVFTYLTYEPGNLDQAKINQWPQERYLNIWLVNTIPSGAGGVVLGDYYTPLEASYSPYYDGIIFNYETYPSYLDDGEIAYYFARYLNLPHPCNGYGHPLCADNDGIADTPPCDGEYYTCTNIYDTACDTPNVQNVMTNNTTCGIMFTYGQGQYMQNVLQLDFGNRASLIAPYTFSATGMHQPMQDLAPVADFSVNFPFASHYPYWFACQAQNIIFKNESWNDTIVSAAWTFSNNADVPTSNSLTAVVNKFHQPGWVTVTLAATGNNTGTSELINSNAAFIADSIATNAFNYVQEFTPGSGMDKWPIFNYYRNNFKWQLANTGYFDNSSIEYTSYDTRTFPENTTGSPQGDIDDIFTPGFDLTVFSGECYLNFMSSGASFTTNIHNMNDSLEIDYSTNASTWYKLKVLKGEALDNKGAVSTPYTPSGPGDWVANSISLPIAAITPYTIFRFRYHPGANDTTGISSGNNFYLDHFNFNSFPESVAMIDKMPDGLSLLPNPTHGDSYVVIKDRSAIATASLVVTDITGKVVYETTSHSNTNNTRIEIPANVLLSKGLYLVHVITDNINQTEKLVVY